MGLLNRKKKEENPNPEKLSAFEKAHICVNGPAITISLRSVATTAEYANEGMGFGLHGPSGYKKVATTRFSGSLDEAREYAAALNVAILDATRLEGAVASIYPVK